MAIVETSKLPQRGTFCCPPSPSPSSPSSPPPPRQQLRRLHQASAPHFHDTSAIDSHKLIIIGRLTPPLKTATWNVFIIRQPTLKESKAPQQLAKAFDPQNPLQQLAKASLLLCHGTSRGPTSCLYWASKLLRGTFWASLKSFKSLAAAFEGLWTAKPSAAACEGVPPALPWDLPRPHKLFILGFETATWHVLSTP